MGHALLLSGPPGMGINRFAQFTAAGLLCFSPSQESLPCGICKSCELLAAGNHPDLQTILPEEEGKQIKVDQIRELIDFINLKSQYERYKIAIITPADAMNRSAANTLLKTLEEPPAQSLLILISRRPNLLPVTIRSRCQQIHFNPALDDTATAWLRAQINGHDRERAAQLLALAAGAPLAALALLENNNIEKQIQLAADLESLRQRKNDPVSIAEQWNKAGAVRIFQWLLQMVGDMVRLKSSGGHVRFCQGEVYPYLQRLANQLDLYELMQCHDLLLKSYGLCLGQVSYNTRGLLEDFIICWQQQTRHTEGEFT